MSDDRDEDRKVAIVVTIIGIIIGIMAGCYATTTVSAQTVTNVRFSAPRSAGRADTTAQDVLWGVSGFVADSFRVRWGWSDWGRDSVRQTPPKPIDSRGAKLPGWARKRTVLWADPYGKTVQRWACVQGYRTGVTIPEACTMADLWVPWRSALFVDSLYRNHTVMVLMAVTRGRLSAAAETACKAAAGTDWSVSRVIDLASCAGQVDTAGGWWCLAVLDSAHSWGTTARNHYPKCDESLYRAVRGVRQSIDTVPTTPTPDTTSYPKPSFSKAVYAGAPRDLPGADSLAVWTSTPVLSTVDTIWHAAPSSGNVAANGQTVRWVGSLTVPAGSYEFTVQPDDGFRYWIDGVLIRDSWVPQSGQTYRDTVALTAGAHTLKVEYYNSSDNGYFRFGWRKR
jgi:hypothetical protein